PIDMLSFITIHKNSNWKKHSYVALCGVSEQALFKMLEINPSLSHVVLCLDYDSAGIEACEKISDMLIGKNINCSRLKSNRKDWNEDLKAIHNMQSISAEEHPQHLLKDELCEEILVLVKGVETIEINHSDGEKSFKEAQQQNGSQAEAMKTASAIFLCLALKEYRQLEKAMTAEEIVRKMRNEFRAYQNRGRWNPTLSDIEEQLLAFKHQRGIVSELEKTAIAEHYEKTALELLKSAIRLEMTQQKQVQAPMLKMA
ncbi:MAG: toprim domain-containing protein, partial [Ruminiclostridium sp.]